MTDKEKKDLLSDLDSKIVKYIGKQVIKDVESQINDLLPPKDEINKENELQKKVNIDTNLEQESNNPETNKELKEEKSLVSSIDNKLNELIGKDTVSEIEEDLLSFIPGHIDNVNDLGSKLDNFLTETNHFGIEFEPNTTTEGQSTEKKFTNKKVEEDLQRLKQNIKPNDKAVERNIHTNEEPENKTTDKIVEKKFKDREIEDALTALKSKCALKNKQTDTNQIQQENKTDTNVSNEEIDSSLQGLLKNLDK